VLFRSVFFSFFFRVTLLSLSNAAMTYGRKTRLSWIGFLTIFLAATFFCVLSVPSYQRISGTRFDSDLLRTGPFHSLVLFSILTLSQ